MEAVQSDASLIVLKDILTTEKKRLRFARVGFVFSIGALLLGVIAVIALLIGVHTVKTTVSGITDTLTDTATRVNAVADHLNGIDFETLETSYLSFAETGVETMEQMQTSLTSLSDLSVQAEEALKKLKEIDIETLNQSISQLNQVLTPMANFFGRFGG